MKRKLLSILLAVSLVVGSTQVISPFNTTITSAAEVSLPKKGQVINGFKVTDITYDAIAKTNQLQFTHVKSGAKMLVLKNDSKNRGFAIGFNTPAQNDKGINHILEHAIVGGSEKYPSKNLIFDLNTATYTSFVNAFTYQNMTMYPICSESEEQLMKLTDIYMSSVYQPLFAKDKKIFEREAWRYSLEDANSPINITGVVYNEMRGNYGNINTAAYYNGQKSIFPNINQSNVSGGKPESVLTLSYEEFVKTYKANYHPSNSIMVLYGDINYVPFLKMLNDDYLSSYTKKTFNIKHTTQKKFTKLVEKNYSFPASKSADTKNKSVIELIFAVPDIKKFGIENYTGLAVIASLLNVDNSSFKQALTNSKIAESYSVSVGVDTYQPTIRFSAYNADPAKKKELYNLIMKELKATVKNGIDKDLASSLFSSLKFDQVLGTEGSTPQNSLVNACLYNNIFDNPTVNIQQYYKSINDKLSTGYLENLMDTYIVKNTHAALVTTTPKAGLLEQNEAALTKKLADKKASMSKSQISTLIKNTKSFNTWNNEKTTNEVLASMNALSAKDLPVEVKEYNIKDTINNGYRQIIADADVSDVGNIGFVFDESHLDKDELHYLKFYADLLSCIIPAGKYKEEDLINTIVRQTNNLSFTVNGLNNNNTSESYPAFIVQFNSLNDDYETNLSLLKDMLIHSDLSLLPEYGQRTISYLKMGFQQAISEPLNLLLVRSLAYTNETQQLSNYLTGLDYYNFILSLEKELADNPKDVIQKLTDVRNKLFSKTNLTVLFAGNNASQKLYLKNLPVFTDAFTSEHFQPANYVLPKPAKREAFTTNSAVQYMVVNSGLTQNGITSDGKYKVISSLLTNLLLIPEIRLKGGSYGAEAGIVDTNFYNYTYRDNNFVQSLATIQSSGTYLNQISPLLTQADLDNYIISTFAASNISTSELNGAVKSMYNRMVYKDDKELIELLNQIKSTTVEEVQSASTDIEKLNKNSNYIVVAPESMIEENKNLFDTITPLN